MRTTKPRHEKQSKTIQHLDQQDIITNYFIPVIFLIGGIWVFTPQSFRDSLKNKAVPFISGGSGLVAIAIKYKAHMAKFTRLLSGDLFSDDTQPGPRQGEILECAYFNDSEELERFNQVKDYVTKGLNELLPDVPKKDPPVKVLKQIVEVAELPERQREGRLITPLPLMPDPPPANVPKLAKRPTQEMGQEEMLIASEPGELLNETFRIDELNLDPDLQEMNL